MLTSAADYITRSIKNIFVPDKDFLSDKVQSIRDKFGIIDSVTGTIDVLEDFFVNVASGVPPKIEIDLSKAESQYDYGGTAYALDMGWYAKYKPIVDVVLSAIIWVLFAWRIFVRMPSIISGFSSNVDSLGGGK